MDGVAVGSAPEIQSFEAVEEVVGAHRLDEVVERAESDAKLGIVDKAQHYHGNGARRLVVLEAGKDLPAVDLG